MAEVPEHLARPGPATVEVELAAACEAWGEGGVLWLEEGVAGRRARLQPPVSHKPSAEHPAKTPTYQSAKTAAERSAKTGPAAIKELVGVVVAQVEGSRLLVRCGHLHWN